MTARGLRRMLLGVVLVTLFSVFPAGVAMADHLVVDVVAPDAASLGEEIEIRAAVRLLETGDPVEDVEIVFYSDASFAGVAGEVELGRVITDEAGVAILSLRLAVSGTHAIRVEAVAGPEIQPESVSIPVTVGGQLVRSEAGIDIPGFGGWIVTAVIVLVWSIMLVAVVRLVMVARAGPSGRRFGFAEGILVVATLLAIGLTALLIRSPDTHANLNPEGYQRTAVAFTQADYLYPGPGLIAGIPAEESVAYGRAIFMSRGCAGCHGIDALGAATAGTPALASRQWMGQVVRTGLPGGMPSYTEVDLSEEDLDAMFVFLFAARAGLEDLEPAEPTTTTPTVAPVTVPPPTSTTAATTGTTTAATTSATTAGTTSTTGAVAVAPTYDRDVAPIFAAHCDECHGTLGGWDAASRDTVINSGDHGPVVIPGDPDASLLVQKVQGTQTEGLPMPPSGLMSDFEIQVVIDWIAGGAP